MDKLKIALAIPVYGMTHAKFTQSLANLIAHTLGADFRDAEDNALEVEMETFMVSCSMLTESRHRLVAEALAWDADYMLYLDADHTFPADSLVRLLSHGLPVVGCNYARRFTPTAPTAANDDGLLYTTQEKADAEEVEACAHLGFGVLLIDMRIFDALQAHAEQEGDGNFLPLFMFEPTEDKIGMVGEDVYFFRKLAKAGVKPFVDHGLSWQVGHCFETILTNQTALAHKDAWGEHRATRAKKFADKAAEIEGRAELSLMDQP